jgi:hypothetical protein
LLRLGFDVRTNGTGREKIQRRRGWLELFGEVKSLITTGGKVDVAPASIQKETRSGGVEAKLLSVCCFSV